MALIEFKNLPNTSTPINETNLNNNFNEIANIIYPVGSIYMSVNSTSPATLFGGTWEQLKDKFLLGAGDTYSAGTTGGEAEHTLTVNEMPEHRHEGLYWNGDTNLPISLNAGSYSKGYKLNFSSTADANKICTANAGGSQPHNNMPPYLAVYMWKRTA